MLGDPACQPDLRIVNILSRCSGGGSWGSKVAHEITPGEATHWSRFVQPYRGQFPAEQDLLQMPGSMTNLKDAPPLDKRDNTPHPILPATQRDRGCHQVVGKGEWVV